MHPSSFYDLWARYTYTPLYGPYSLSEALEGLIFYSLNESQDSISIGSKRTLQHELILELSNVTDDLQDYLIYFSSNFLIFPLNSSDLFKELRAGCDGFEPLSIHWGAIITHLVVACKIVEHNFWPLLFQPVINNPTSFPRRQHPPFAFPNVSSDKSPASTSASTFISSPHMDNSPCFQYCLLQSHRLPFNVQSEHPQTIPSMLNPTGGKEDHSLSLRLDNTPLPSKSHHTRFLSNGQPLVASLKLCFPPTGENRLDEAPTLQNHTISAQWPGNSTSVHTSNAREPGSLKKVEKVAEIDEQITRETGVAAEGDEVTTAWYAHPHPTQLTSTQAEVIGELATVPSRTLLTSTALWLTSTTPDNTCNFTPNFLQGSTTISALLG